MPLTIALAATLQLALAALFLVIPVTVWFTGAAAQRAAEAEVAAQGHPPEVLARHGIRFEEERWEFGFALSIGALLTALASLTLAAHGGARLASWIAEPLIFLVVGFITAGQVFAVKYTEAAFKRSEDPAARTVDAKAVIAAANSGFPRWLRALVLVRFPLATLGSLLVVALLATPSAAAYFG
ncbi:hypothetical protein AB0C77_07905 [Streptomyces sp. NPDC048629]|uniref:hypothetical protein n=1 Tax=Streptomyces sp. NPDC048629 TaxID=3154824 RepID=UPI003426BB67